MATYLDGRLPFVLCLKTFSAFIHVADSYAKICVLIRENMHTDKFRLHLSRANVMKSYGFPNGVSRLQQTDMSKSSFSR